jgi:hypothetical protein
MNRAAIIAGVVGTAVAGMVLALPQYGIQLPLPIMIGVAAALATGAVFALVTATIFPKVQPKVSVKSLLDEPVSMVKELIDFFPTAKIQALSIRPETSVRSIDTAQNPQKYAGRKIVMHIRQGGPNEVFNPIKLREIFAGLANSPDFEHVLLFDEGGEFLAYFPGPIVRTFFTTSGSEGNITEWLIGHFYPDKRKLLYMQLFGGAGRLDTVFMHEKVSVVADRLKGGFRHLVVLDGRSLKKPVGVIHAEKMIEMLARAGVATRDLISDSTRVQTLRDELNGVPSPSLLE